MAASAGGTMAALDREVCTLLVEMHSEKITVRQKAFSKMALILSYREDEFLAYMNADSFGTEWSTVFDAVYLGIIKQSGCSAASVKGKNHDYFVVLHKLSELAMDREEPRLQFSQLIEASLRALEDASIRVNFGVPFVQVLQKFVLSSKWDLTVVGFETWKAILDCSFLIMNENQIARQVAVACLSTAVRKFLENCSMPTLLVEYLPQLMEYIRQTEKGKLQHELMRVAFHVVQAIAVDCRMKIVLFLDSLLPYVIKAYEAKMDCEQKSVLFHLMHLSLIILYPGGKPQSVGGRLTNDHPRPMMADEKAHSKTLRQYYYIVTCELKAYQSSSFGGGGRRENTFTDGFINFAARLSWMVHWNEDIWNEQSSEESEAKRVKRSNKLQSLMDTVTVGPNQYNGNWFIITSVVLQRYKGALLGEDYQPLLQLLCDIQSSLQSTDQQNAFHRCCTVLLQFEKTDAFRSFAGSVIDEAFCSERWHKIITAAHRGCTSTVAKESAENNLLLQLLIRHRKYPSITFLVGTVLKAFYTYAIKKTNVNARTVLAILETLDNVECLGNVDEILEKLFNYLYPQTRETQTKEILHSKERLDAKLLAKISALAVVTKHRDRHSEIKDNRTNERTQRRGLMYVEQDDRFKCLEQYLMLQNVDEVITMVSGNTVIDSERESAPVVTYNVNESLFKRLCEAMNFEKNALPDNNCLLASALTNICYDLELYIEILDVLLYHQAYDEAQCNKCILTKKVQFKMQEIVLGLQRLLDNAVSLSCHELTEIGDRLLAIFRGCHHACVKKLLERLDVGIALRWSMKQMNNSPGQDSQCAEILRSELLTREQQTKRCFLNILVYYLQYDGVCMTEAIDMLNSLELNVYSNLDIFYTFDLCRILLRRPSQELIADWIMIQLMAVCKQHHTSVAVTEEIIELYADLVMFVSPYEAMVRNVTTILHSFIKKCTKCTYSAELQSKIVGRVKFLLRAFPQHFESPLHEKMYMELVPLLSSPSYRIKIEVVRNFLHFLNPEWTYREEALIPGVYYDFLIKLYGMVKMDDLIATTCMEKRVNTISAYVQLLLGTFSLSYMLRRRALTDLVILVHAANLSDGKIKSSMRLVSDICGINAEKVLQAHINTVLEVWLTKGYKLTNFPFRLAGNAGTLDEFVQLNKKNLAFLMLCMQPGRFEHFCATIEVESATLLKAILPKCVFFLLPKYAKCGGMCPKYAAMADRMHKVMSPYLRTVDLNSHILDIVKYTTYRLHDSDELAKLLEHDVPRCFDDDVPISKINYFKSMEHLKQSICVSNAPKQMLLSYLCLKNSAHIERTLMEVKRWLWDAEEAQQKAIHLLQYNALLEQLKEYISQQTEKSFKRYLVRDVIHFLCNLLTTLPALRLPILTSLDTFLQLVVSADDAEEMLSIHLHFIVSSLLEVEHIEPSSKVSQKALSMLRLLIDSHSTTFASAIGKLNYLPNDDRFFELRNIISRHKIMDGEKPSLIKEMTALTQLPKLRYEDLVALKIMLSSRKDELKSICHKSTIVSVSSDSDASMLHGLIAALIEVVRSSPFDKRTVEALRCLGEVGPIDLGTILMRSEVETVAYDVVENVEDAIKKAAETILLELNVLLTSKNIAIGQLASQIAYQLLHGKTFHPIATKLPTLFPFLGRASSEVSLFAYGSVPRLTIALEDERIDYRMFVQQLTMMLLSSLKNTMLTELAGQEETFAEKIVPLLIQITLKLFQTSVYDEISLFINGFFGKFAASQAGSVILFNNPKAIQLMLTIVECVRMHNQQFPQHPTTLNYLPIAKASQYCQAHLKAIFYGELWYQSEAEHQHARAAKDRTLLEIMKSSHVAIGVFDAVKAFLNPIEERSEYYSLEQNHSGALIFQDASLSFQGSGLAGLKMTETFSQVLNDAHMFALARSLNTPGRMDYECLWRLADWNVAIDAAGTVADGNAGQTGLTQQSQLFERAHYKALKCLHLKDELAMESAISEGRQAVVEMFKLTSTESTKHIYHGLCRLRQLQQIEDFGEIHFFKKIDCEQDLLDTWDRQDQLPYSEFELMERLLSQRLSIFNTGRVVAKRKWIPRAIYSTLLLLIHESRVRGQHNCALRNIRIAGSFELPPNVKAIVQLEDAQLNWSLGDRKLACNLALEVMDNQKYKDLMVNAIACRVYGTFLAESHTKEVTTLYKDYFVQSEKCVKRALAQSKSESNPSQLVKVPIALDHRCFESDRNFAVYYTVAKYADRELARLDKFLHSKDWETRQKNIVNMEEEIQRLKQEASGATDQKRKDIMRQYSFTHKNVQRDRKAAEMVESDRLVYLELALANYILYAKQDTIESDLVIFRILSLWLNNLHEVQVQELVEKSIGMIPSHKFIAVLPQLTARLSVKDRAGKVVESVLLRCAMDHPHHTLPYVFAQLYAFRDLPENEAPEDDDRLQGAKLLYEQLKDKPAIAQIVTQMDRMNLALIELANKPMSKSASFQAYTMTHCDALRSLKNLDRIQCPTIELPVIASGSYSNLLRGVYKWDAKIVGVGGINAPKKLTCRSLDGLERTQLLKGKDDMRQDAVMQQVFGILNVLLRNDKETAKQKLSIRTYKVVPLSRQSGVLEWCNDTVPIGVWLAAGHEKYRPQDLKPVDARKKFTNNAQPGMMVDNKLENFKSICRKISPVFRYFFLEHYLDPGTWFERRQNYTKSVATSSMIGHILGIGDRHVQNILIDKRTAEVIHIDFGIAFEMGKNLPTPETIPFRLTRDIVDGMGMSGVEGVFTKSCEKTMEVLRNNQAPLLTILEVLLYDPLYSWNVLSNKKANRQQMFVELAESSGEDKKDGTRYTGRAINVTAERALIQIKKKLDGEEDDKLISVEGQVQKLIFSATSERNLCQLFQGWQPYL